MGEVKHDGGPAFPHPGGANDASVQVSHMGMSLRDWFAGQALASIMQDKSIWDSRRDERYDVAVRMYEWADAMIAARKASPSLHEGERG